MLSLALISSQYYIYTSYYISDNQGLINYILYPCLMAVVIFLLDLNVVLLYICSIWESDFFSFNLFNSERIIALYFHPCMVWNRRCIWVCRQFSSTVTRSEYWSSPWNININVHTHVDYIQKSNSLSCDIMLTLNSKSKNKKINKKK